ncbi:MAG: hypothetical protein WBN23_06335 [Woeseia sp.]
MNHPVMNYPGMIYPSRYLMMRVALRKSLLSAPDSQQAAQPITV